MHPLIAKAKLEAVKAADSKLRELVYRQLSELDFLMVSAQREYERSMYTAGYCPSCEQSVKVCNCPIAVMA